MFALPTTALVLALAAPEPIRGMTVSCPGWGQTWGDPAMLDALREMKQLGVNAVALHPYAGVHRDGAVTWQPAQEIGFLLRAIAYTKSEAVQLYWVPHLAHWGSFDWRGSIEFNDEAAWQKFFSTYQAFIVNQASFAQRHGAQGFAVGLEYERTMHREADWRRVIAAVRKVYHGPIVYVANWDGLEQVRFWDAVDLIGVQGYFPLAPKGADPTEAELYAAWEAPLARLRALSSRYGKRILFSEIGYPRGPEAASKPWVPEVSAEPALLALRARLMRTALKRLEQEPQVVGMFWWKWIPGSTRWDRDFSMRDPEAQQALADFWKRSATIKEAESHPAR